MFKTKINELQGAALDWAVAKCEGFLCDYTYNKSLAAYSTDWAQGGPIIEREKIALVWQFGDKVWEATEYLTHEMVEQYAPRP